MHLLGARLRDQVGMPDEGDVAQLAHCFTAFQRLPWNLKAAQEVKIQ